MRHEQIPPTHLPQQGHHVLHGASGPGISHSPGLILKTVLGISQLLHLWLSPARREGLHGLLAQAGRFWPCC